MNEKVKSFIAFILGSLSAACALLVGIFVGKRSGSSNGAMAKVETELGNVRTELTEIGRTQSERGRTQSERERTQSERVRIDRENANIIDECKSIIEAVEKRNKKDKSESRDN